MKTLAACLLLATAPLAAQPAPPGDPITLAREGYFYAGGQRMPGGGMTGQMFVEYQIPAHQTHRTPLVLIHGNYQNGANFLGTPDDRPGWREYFVRHGYAVYVVDQPARGRSDDDPANGPSGMPNAEGLQRQFTAIERYDLWPQAHLHTQWPGTGIAGDPAFDQAQAAQQPSLRDNVRMDVLNRQAGRALLERIGPAVLVTHSRSGAIGWVIADDAPNLVKAIVAIEPSGPPFYDVVPVSMTGPRLARSWGLAYDHLTYDPPATPDTLTVTQEATPQAPGLERCWALDTPRRLPHLAGIPVMILTAEASYHAGYDHCTAQFLSRAGVANELVPLASRGIHGNGHMMMWENNNLEIAGVIDGWVAGHAP